MLPPVFTAAPCSWGRAGGTGHCGQQEAAPRWSHLPGGPWEPRHISTGKELVCEAKLPSGPRHTCYGRERFLPPTPALAGAGGGVPSAALGRRCAALRAAGSVLLLLLRCDCGDAVLSPEAFHEEVDDGAVEVLPEGGAVEVMALVRVDL